MDRLSCSISVKSFIKITSMFTSMQEPPSINECVEEDVKGMSCKRKGLGYRRSGLTRFIQNGGRGGGESIIAGKYRQHSGKLTRV